MDAKDFTVLFDSLSSLTKSIGLTRQDIESAVKRAEGEA
jgi:biotin operon repressor